MKSIDINLKSSKTVKIAENSLKDSETIYIDFTLEI
jgi:hypothetical protein